MKTVYVTVGPNGAGKTTWAKKQNAIYVGFDEIGDLNKMFEIINKDITKDYVFEAVNTKASDWFYILMNTPWHKHVGVFFDVTADEAKERCIKKGREDLVQYVDRDLKLIEEAKPQQDRFFDEVIHV